MTMITISSYDITIHSISPSQNGEAGLYILKYENQDICAKLHIDESVLLEQGSKATVVCDGDNPIFLISTSDRWFYIGQNSLYPYYNKMDGYANQHRSSPLKKAWYYMMTTGAMQILTLIVVAALAFILSYTFIGHSAYLISSAAVVIASLGIGRAKNAENTPLSATALKHAIKRHNKTVRLATLPAAISLSVSLLYCYANALTADVMATIIISSIFISCFISAELVKLTYRQHMSLDIPGNYARAFWREVAVGYITTIHFNSTKSTR